MPHLKIAIHVDLLVTRDNTIEEVQKRWVNNKMSAWVCRYIEESGIGSVNDVNVYERKDPVPDSKLTHEDIQVLLGLIVASPHHSSQTREITQKLMRQLL